MNQMTQEEFSAKYGISRAYASKAFKEANIQPSGTRAGQKRALYIYDEKAGALAIINALKTHAEKARSVYEKAFLELRRVEAIVIEDGLADELR